jgi:hypothetical protein
MIIKTILALSLLTQVGLEDFDAASATKESIAKVQAAMHLSDSDYKLAVAAASAFVYVGPCEGTKLPNDDAVAAMQLIIGADPSIPYQAAALEMIGLFMRSNLGRPIPSLCALAFELAKIPLK